ncbi:MAG: SGNH/GDSL hydrolase family protein [Eubacteriales bacterium]
MEKKRLMLLGDSWRQFYENEVRKALEGEFDIWSPGEENCRFSGYTLSSLRMYLQAFPAPDIVHWNNGLWDTAILYPQDGSFTPLPVYLETLEKIVRELRRAGASVIFATTGAVSDKAALFPGPLPARQDNGVIVRYNAAARELMTRLGVALNDIHAAVYPERERYICKDCIHPNTDGVQLCASLAVQSIRRAAAARDGVADGLGDKSGTV